MSTLNVPQFNPKEATLALLAIFDRFVKLSSSDKEVPGIFLHGSPGIGKSAAIKSLAELVGAKFTDIRLPLIEPSELRGLPYFDHDAKTTVYFPTDLLPPTDSKDTHIVFFDEINATTPMVQAQAYQLIQDRVIGTYKLPKKTFIIAAGNKADDNAVVFNMPSALANRFTHMEIVVSHEAWNDWALSQPDFDDLVIAFLKMHSDLLHQFDSESAGQMAFPTPRSWSFVSSLQVMRELQYDAYFKLVAGTIGDDVNSQFKTWMNHKDTIADPVDILDGKAYTLPDTPDGQFVLMGYLLRELFNSSGLNVGPTKDRIEEYFNYATRYENSSSADHAVALIHQLLSKAANFEPMGLIPKKKAKGKKKTADKKDSEVKVKGTRRRARKNAAETLMGITKANSLKMEILQLSIYQSWEKRNKSML